MERLFFLTFSVVFFLGCSAPEREVDTNDIDSTVYAFHVEEIDTNPIFAEVDPVFDAEDLILPEGFSYRILFQEKTDSVVREDGKKFPAKGNHDLTVFIPDEKEPESKGLVYVSHETKYANKDLGDGGGATIFSIKKIEGYWQITSDFKHVDFSGVGFTNRNCGGSLTPNNTVFTCEESWAWNTAYLYQDGKGHRDTSWVNGRPIWQNMGYVVEVDPFSGKVIQKHYKMGKFVHEDALCSADGRTVYLTDDNSPGVFFKYKTKKPFDYSDGQLFAYKQSDDGMGGEWLTLPMDTLSLIHCRDSAIARGASMFIRHEWVEEVNGKLYICETGEDEFSWAESIAKGGAVPNYVKKGLAHSNTKFDDAFGRVLVFDPQTNKMSVYLEGGFISDSLHCFSNPDCNTSVTLGGRDFLVLSEDINWYSRGRVSSDAERKRNFVNEIYFLPVQDKPVTRDDLLRFCVAPLGAETTGVVFLPDGAMLMNIQHPSARNKSKLNKSSTIIVEGFKK
jgi:secreted PhoX family phosphatase